MKLNIRLSLYILAASLFASPAIAQNKAVQTYIVVNNDNEIVKAIVRPALNVDTLDWSIEIFNEPQFSKRFPDIRHKQVSIMCLSPIREEIPEFKKGCERDFGRSIYEAQTYFDHRIIRDKGDTYLSLGGQTTDDYIAFNVLDLMAYASKK